MIGVDSSALFAALDESEPKHEQVAAALATAGEPPVLSPFVLTELDYFLVRHLGVPTELAFLARSFAEAMSLRPSTAKPSRERGL